MKKFYLGALGCLLAMGASAQTFEPVGTLNSYGIFYTIPSALAFNGESCPYSGSKSEDGNEIHLYNKSFGIERTINVKNPTSYSRVEVDSRKAVTSSTETTVDCSETRMVEIDDYQMRTFTGYRDYYAEHYGYSNEVYTDECVYEWLEYMKVEDPHDFEGTNILEKREVDGGSLFVTRDDDEVLAGFYFKDNQLFWYEHELWQDFPYINEYYHYSEDYYTFYNRKNAVFTEEYIREYINDAGRYNSLFGLNSADYYVEYSVDSIVTTSTGETYFYTEVGWNNFPETFKADIYFVWKEESIIVHLIEYTTSYTGEWVKTTENYSDDSGLVGFSVQIIGSAVDAEDTYCIATQTLFNNDAKWEFLRKVYEECIVEDYWETKEEDRDGDGEIDYKRTRYENKVKGYEIVSEDGTVLATIDAPLSDDNSPGVNLLLWGEDAFLALTTWEYMEEDDTEYLTTIYSIDKTTTRVTKVASAPAMRVSPTIANRNSTVNVTLGGETAKNGGELIITDSNGRTIGRSRVEAGQTNVPVTTNRMGSGVYNITLTEKGQKVDNARIIVK